MGEAFGRRQRLSVGGAVRVAALVGTAGLLLAGCSDSLPSMPKIGDLNPFAEKEKPLPGTRIPIIPAAEKIPGDLASADKPIALPAPSVNDTWSQPGGTSSNAPGHLALAGAVRQAWSADAGSGSSSSGKLTASPIVYEGRVYTLDAAARVTAFAVSGGSTVWRASVVPEKEKAEKGYGGGIAADSGRIYVATGFGTIAALDPGSGKKLWEKSIGVPVRASPTAAADRVFVVTTDGRAICFNGGDGNEVWSFRGLPERTSIISNPSPAVDGDTVVIPYPTGDVVALRVSDGQQVWQENLAKSKSASAIASLSDAARPAIDQGVVYAVGHGGRMVATQQRSGERLWSLNIPGTQTPWVAGDSVFVVDTSGQLMAISRRDGKIQWTTRLPGNGTWSGPTLAGGQLWLASSKGQLAAVEAVTGKMTSTQDVGGPVYIGPVVAQGRLFVLTDKARLVALGG